MIILNKNIFYFFNHLAGHSVLLDSIIIFIASYLPWILVIFTVFYFVFFKRSISKFLVLVFMVIVPSFLTQVLKWEIFRHPRPFLVLPHVTKLISATSFDSFPSGHATAFAALATAVYIYNRKLGAVFIIGAILIGAARVAAGVHYPFDVLTGYVIGFVISILCYRFLTFMSRVITDFIS